jgi:hypothetical protein
MSYVRFDDAHEDGQLTAFRERLAGEIRIQAGREFPIFQDRNDIAWGQNWRQTGVEIKTGGNPSVRATGSTATSTGGCGSMTQARASSRITT